MKLKLKRFKKLLRKGTVHLFKNLNIKYKIKESKIVYLRNFKFKIFTFSGDEKTKINKHEFMSMRKFNKKKEIQICFLDLK